MPPLSRRPNAKTYTEAELADTWLVIQREFERYFWEDAAEIKLLGLVRKQPAFHRPFYRVATVRRLRLAGLGVQEIAQQLGISARHVRRLRRRNVYAAAKAAVEQIRNRLRMDRGDARRVMAALRARLVAEGFQPHQRTVALKEGARPPRSKRVPAIKTYRLTVDEYRTLERAGLTTEELWAIFTVGIPTDELHELLVRGAAAPRKDGKGP